MEKEKKSRKKRLLALTQKYVTIFIGAVITAVGLEIFLIPNNIIDGGVVGLSIMAHAITEQPLGVFLILFNLPFLYIGCKQIGKAFAIATMTAIFLLSLWSAYFAPFPTVTQDLFLAAIFGGIIVGLGVGLIIRSGGSLDGTEIVAIILDKKSVFDAVPGKHIVVRTLDAGADKPNSVRSRPTPSAFRLAAFSADLPSPTFA